DPRTLAPDAPVLASISRYARQALHYPSIHLAQPKAVQQLVVAVVLRSRYGFVTRPPRRLRLSLPEACRVVHSAYWTTLVRQRQAARIACRCLLAMGPGMAASMLRRAASPSTRPGGRSITEEHPEGPMALVKKSKIAA